MNPTRCPKQSSRGFTLVELAVVLLVVGLMAGFGLQATQVSTSIDCYAQTRTQMNTINEAISRFTATNERLPLPAGRSLGVADANYGREAASTGSTDIDRIVSGIYATNPVLSGALPFQALQLPTSFATDCWGNKFSYVVGEKFVTTPSYTATADGPIEIRRGTLGANVPLTTRSSYVVISHGSDAAGGVKGNYIGGSHGWCTVGPRIDSENCDLTSAGNAIFYFTDVVNGTTPAAYSDDLLVYGAKKSQAGNLYCWGTDTAGSGILADNSTVSPHSSYNPTSAINNIKFDKLTDTNAPGTLTPCALTTDGTAYCWGYNGSGAIGDGTFINKAVPTKVLGTTKFKEIYQLMGDDNNADSTHCGIARDDAVPANDDTVWCWGAGGANTYSYLPWPLFSASNPTPIQLSAIKFSKLVSAPNSSAMCGLAKTGEVYCWGSQADSNLGQGAANVYSRSASTPTLVSGATRRFSDIAGLRPLCGLTSAADPGGAGKIYCWGEGKDFSAVNLYANQLGSLGLPPLTITNITQANPGVITYTPTAGAGVYNLSAGDEVWVQNVNGMGQINYNKFGVAANSGPPLNYTDGSTSPALPNYTIRLVQTDHNDSVAAINTTGYGAYTSGGQLVVVSRNTPTLLAFDSAGTPLPLFEKLINNSSALTSVASGGKLYSWGRNSYNQLGNGLAADASTGTSIVSITNNNPALITTFTAHNLVVGDVFGIVNGARATRTAQGGTGGGNTIILNANDSAVANAYLPNVAVPTMPIAIVGGTGTGQNNTISSYSAGTKVATVSTAWATQPDNTSVYQITPSWTARGGANATSIILNSRSSQAPNFYVGATVTINGTTNTSSPAATACIGQTRTITATSGTSTITATVSPAWSVIGVQCIPNAINLYTSTISKTAQGATATTITLDAADNTTPGYYNGLDIVSATGQYLNTISTSTAPPIVTVANPWKTIPTATTRYAIGSSILYFKVGSVPTATTFTVQNLDGTNWNTTKFTPFLMAGKVQKVPTNGDCVAVDLGYVSNCSYTPTPATQPVGVEFNYVSPEILPNVAVTAAGAVQVWGKNTVSPNVPNMGNTAGGTTIVPTNIHTGWLGGDTLVGPIYHGIATACALSPLGKAYCWGANSNGQQGNGSGVFNNYPYPVNTSVRFTGLVPLGNNVSNIESNGMCGLTP